VAAFDLLMDLAGPAVSRQIVIDPREGGGPTRRDHLKAATRWDGFQLDAARTRALKDALEEALVHPRLVNPVMRLRTPDERPHVVALLRQVRAALTDNQDAAKALSEAARRWTELDQAKGAAATIAEYRVSVGLLPK
jgi:hypothetical protein